MKSHEFFNKKNNLVSKYPKYLFVVVICFVMLFSCDNQKENFVKSFDNSSINYDVFGKGKTTIVFIHGGLGCDKRFWDYQTSYFANKYKVVTLSLAGHGKSDSIRSNYTMESYGKDVAAVVNKLNAKKVILIGHSGIGGIVCIEAALNLPNEVIGIIGLDCLNQFELIWEENFVKSFLDRFRADTNKKTQDFIRQMFTEENDPMLVEKTASDFGSVNSSIFFSELENWFNYQNEKFLNSVQRISAPIACIQNGDNVITIDINQKYNTSYSGVKLNNLKHFFPIGYPEITNKEIEKAIQNILKINNVSR